jgi:hypothetical protein
MSGLLILRLARGGFGLGMESVLLLASLTSIALRLLWHSQLRLLPEPSSSYNIQLHSAIYSCGRGKVIRAFLSAGGDGLDGLPDTISAICRAVTGFAQRLENKH